MNHLKESFDVIATRYDAQRRWIIPDFSGFYGAAVRASSPLRENPAILDAGAGTGLLSGMLLSVYPDATITLLDSSEKMLDVARARFRGDGRVRFVTTDYRHVDLGGPLDVICSALLASALARRLSLRAEPFHPPPRNRGKTGPLPEDL